MHPKDGKEFRVLRMESRDLDNAPIGVILVNQLGLSVIKPCTKFEARGFTHSRDGQGSQNFKMGSRDPQHAPWGYFYPLARTCHT